jgi:2'-5' RNA ligase
VTWEVAHALLLTGAAHNLLRDLQLELAQFFDADRNLSLPPHITMKAPFSTDDVGRHKAYLDRLGAETREIQLRLTRIELFADRILYLGVDQAPALPPLSARIQKDLAPEARPSIYEATQTFRHHATIGRVRTDQLGPAGEVVGRTYGLRADIAEIALLLRPIPGEWLVARTAPLRSGVRAR